MGSDPQDGASWGKRISGNWSSILSHWRPYREAVVDEDDLYNQMYRAAIPSSGFFFMLFLASTIASAGLLANSAPTIIGAMIVAPLMSPMMGLAFGLAVLNRRLVLTAAPTIVLGSLVVVLIGYLSIAVLGMNVAGSEILARTRPNLLDLVVALAAGGAGAFAQTRPSIANSIAGVAIAVALVPPLVVVGIGLALGSSATVGTPGLALSEIGEYSGSGDIAAGAFLLFLTNFDGIVVVAILVFVANSFGHWRRALLGLIVLIAASVALIQPLTDAFYVMYAENRFLRLLFQNRDKKMEIAGSISKLQSYEITRQDGIVLLHVEIHATRDRLVVDTQKRVDAFAAAFARDLGEPVAVHLEVVPIELQVFESLAQPGGGSLPVGQEPAATDAQ